MKVFIIMAILAGNLAVASANALTQFNGKVYAAGLDITEKLKDVKLTEYLRDEDGNVLNRLTQSQADELCKKKGLRLPTALELAIYARKYGMNIYLTETNDNILRLSREEINYVSAFNQNPDDTHEIFYFSRLKLDTQTLLGHVNNPGTNQTIWSSSNGVSTGLFSETKNSSLAYRLDEADRWLSPVNINDTGSARCVLAN